MSWTKVRRTVQMYERRAQGDGVVFADYIAQVAVSETQRKVIADELRKITAYRDPVGEQAVNRVLRGDSL